MRTTAMLRTWWSRNNHAEIVGEENHSHIQFVVEEEHIHGEIVLEYIYNSHTIDNNSNLPSISLSCNSSG